MATPQELTATYAFIGPFLADAVLAPYGDNALPLFAMALHLGVENYDTFATESLTDHPADKKADIIYINEAEGWLVSLRDIARKIGENKKHRLTRPAT